MGAASSRCARLPREDSKSDVCRQVFAQLRAGETGSIEIIQISRFDLPKLSAACDIASHHELGEHAAPQQQGDDPR